jgi:carbonic anhydrase
MTVMRKRSNARWCAALSSTAGATVWLSMALALPAWGASHWTYDATAADGPAHWGELDADYEACRSGHNQSPVDLVGPITADLRPLGLHYPATSASLVNTGHTVQIEPDKKRGDAFFTLDGRRYVLQQIHFHTPSEHRVQGHAYPLEAHFVHKDAAGNLAVIAVLFESGAPHSLLEAIWPLIPERSGDARELPQPVRVADLLPRRTDYLRVNGSLTTPPCSEGVLWLVMKAHPEVSPSEVERFAHLVHGHNNRPVQPIYARDVLE